MNWRKWKLGIAVAFFVGLADALSGYLVSDAPNWGKIVAFAVIKGIGGAGLYLRQHPVETISFETERLTKEKL
jgi:hypothetical protein